MDLNEIFVNKETNENIISTVSPKGDLASLSESQCNFLTYGGLKIFSNTISTTYQHLNMKMCALD